MTKNATAIPVSAPTPNRDSLPTPNQDSSSSAADTLALDKLCSSVTERELFLKEYQGPINQRVQMIRSERMKTGNGNLNSAALYQMGQKEIWASLPLEVKDGLKEQARRINSNAKR